MGFCKETRNRSSYKPKKRKRSAKEIKSRISFDRDRLFGLIPDYLSVSLEVYATGAIYGSQYLKSGHQRENVEISIEEVIRVSFLEQWHS